MLFFQKKTLSRTRYNVFKFNLYNANNKSTAPDGLNIFLVFYRVRLYYGNNLLMPLVFIMSFVL